MAVSPDTHREMYQGGENGLLIQVEREREITRYQSLEAEFKRQQKFHEIESQTGIVRVFSRFEPLCDSAARLDRRAQSFEKATTNTILAI